MYSLSLSLLLYTIASYDFLLTGICGEALQSVQYRSIIYTYV